MLKTELDASRPVYYSGRNNNDGHAFVCDGYTDAVGSVDMRFHINWGWGGMSNGYFTIDNLNPGSMGTGGSAGGFNLDQQIIIGIKPGMADAALSCNTVQNDGMIVSNETSNFSFSMTNNGDNDYNGCLALDITTSDYVKNQRIYASTNEFIAAGETKVFDNISKVITLPAGSYFFVVTYGNTCNYRLCYGPVMVVANSTNNTDLTCNYIQADDIITQGTTGNFTASITNNGATDYNSRIEISLLTMSGTQTVSQNISQTTEQIAAGATDTISVPSNITVPKGIYFLVVKYDKNNNLGNIGLNILSYTQVEVQLPTGISDNTFSNIILYPNPATDELFIKSDETIKSVTIFDTLGRMMSTKDLSATGSTSVNVSYLTNGLYLLKVQTDKGAKILKFYKK